ncbi:MAG: copper chaperone PCu(A)C [Helicobacteraceae bacterium]|nr:copper chaperone PCu(A)C [Helicobacteraceae bacterium]
MKKVILVIFIFLNILLAQDDIVITEAYARATPPNVKNSAIFMKITNNSQKAIALIDAKSSVSKIVEIHTNVKENGITKMIKMQKLEIEPNSTSILAPKQNHIMLIDIAKQLVDGDSIDLTLIFDNDKTIKIEKIPVVKKIL